MTRKRQRNDTPEECQARGRRWHRAANRAWVKDHPGYTAADFDHWGSCACDETRIGFRRGSDRVLVVARQKDDPVAALDDRIGSQGGRNQVIESFHKFGAGGRLRDEGGGREAVQLFKENSEMTL